MRLVECVLIEDCLAPKRVGKMVSKKPFKRHQKVVGVVTNIALTPDSQILAIKTKDGYIIPEPFLHVLGEVSSKKSSSKYDDIEYAEVVEDDKGGKSKFKAVSEAYGSIKASDLVGKNAMRSKHAVNFALAGGALGLIYAMLKSKNKFIFATIGIVAGGIAGNYYGNKIKKNEATKERD